MDDIVKIALMLVIIVTFLLMVPVVYERAKVYYQHRTCEQSIDAALTVRTLAGVSGGTIRCPTEKRTFGTDEQVKASVADALKYCWSRWHQGQDKILGEGGVLCDVCVLFEAGDARQVSGIKDYLENANGPGGVSVADYVAKPGATIPDSINTGVLNAVVFRYVGFTEPTYADIHLVPFTADALNVLKCEQFPVSQQGPQP